MLCKRSYAAVHEIQRCDPVAADVFHFGTGQALASAVLTLEVLGPVAF